MIDIRLWGVPEGYEAVALSLARTFVRDFPDRAPGISNYVGYFSPNQPKLCVYKTKRGQIVVRGEE